MLRIWRNLKWWAWNTFVGKTNIVRLPIKRGQFVDSDVRMVFAMFECLVWYVEHELGRPDRDDSRHRGWRLHADGDEFFIDMYLWYRSKTPDEIISIYGRIGSDNEVEKKLRELFERMGSMWT